MLEVVTDLLQMMAPEKLLEFGNFPETKLVDFHQVEEKVGQGHDQSDSSN